MTDINELRRLGEGQQWIGRWYDAGCETLMAERDGEHEEVAHPIPIGLVPYLIAVQPASILELLDRLEAAESDGLEQARLNGMGSEREAALLSKLEAAEKERDALRARIERMEQQEPVAKVRVHRTGGNAGLAWSVAPLNDFDSLPLMRDGDRLYALPGAQPAPSVPDEEAAYSEWFHGEQGVAYDGMWAFAKAAWMARAALNSAPKPEAKP